MKINIALLENDSIYSKRFADCFNNMYPDKFTIFIFDTAEALQAEAQSLKIDLLLISTSYDAAETGLKCPVLYFVGDADIDSYRGYKAICKFQKAELIYKQLLDLYSEFNNDIISLKNRQSEVGAKILAFQSPAGGDGASTAAAACAVNLAMSGKRVLYLNYEELNSTDMFFRADGQSSFDEVIYAVKSHKNNLNVKLETALKKDESGVLFYSGCKTVLNMVELSGEERIELINVLKCSGKYDYIVLDSDYKFDGVFFEILQLAHKIVYVSSGMELSLHKLGEACKALRIYEEQNEVNLSQIISVIYNKFINGVSKTAELPGIKAAGGIPAFENASSRETMLRMAQMKLFDNIIQ